MTSKAVHYHRIVLVKNYCLTARKVPGCMCKLCTLLDKVFSAFIKNNF